MPPEPRPQSVFTPVVAAVVLVAMGGTMALRALESADSFRPELNQREPPLAATLPALGPEPARVSRRVALVIIDGLRLRGSYGNSLLDSLRRRGVDAVARSQYPTYSRPNHVAILTGVPPAWSGVRNNAYGWPVAIDSLMDRANAADLESAYAADLAFGVGMMFHDDFAAVHYAPWPDGFARAARLVVGQDYPLVVLLPGAVDAAGHRRGAEDHLYAEATAQVDRELAAALAPLDLARDTIIITADHGHTRAGGHGGTEPDVVEVPLIMAGAGIRPGAALAEVELVDIAPTAAALLGLPAPRHGLGRTLVEATTLSPMQRALLTRADNRRLQRNHATLERVKEQLAPLMERRRQGRTAAVIAVALLALALLVAAHRLGVIHIGWRVLAIAVPAFPLTYYALIDLLGQRVSLSALPDRADATGTLFHFGLVSTAVQVVAGWIALRGRVVLRDRLAAANALTLCGMMVAWLPAGLMWALFGPRTFLEPPASRVMVLVPAAYIAVACHALAAAVTLGLEIVVFFARAVDPRVRLRRLERAAERERRRLENRGELG
ncbi:MAG TPA: alkaline phosphatase family protein [Kofleriaceae bacterium]|nr:alkaline phosphatase family protein [Kofleriaceae bacterium]